MRVEEGKQIHPTHLTLPVHSACLYSPTADSLLRHFVVLRAKHAHKSVILSKHGAMDYQRSKDMMLNTLLSELNK